MLPPATMPHISEDVRDSIIENSYKAIADKIWDILDKVRDKTATAQRRWVWELMQNAKDTPNRFGQVSIAVQLTPEALLFAHNGNAFEVKNLTSLVQQVSRKDSTNAEENVTGKFGTGFISTHMLADQIEVRGVVKRPGDLRRAFHLLLDRRASRPEDLVAPIKLALEQVQQLDDDAQYPLLPDYEEQRPGREQILDTTFRYPLGEDTPESSQWRAARRGWQDLEATLPATLVVLQPLIRQVTLVRDGQTRCYQCRSLPAQDGVARFAIDVTDEQGTVLLTRCFLSHTQDSLQLLAEVRSFTDLALLPSPGGPAVAKELRAPTLFRDFPLVGSDTYQLPFQVQGSTFHPYETRDGLWLNEGNKAHHNRALLEQLVPVALWLSGWLVRHQATNLARLAWTRVPLEAQLDAGAQNWYRDHVQLPWRRGLLELELVETAAGTRTSLRQARVPRYRAQHIDKDQNYRFGALVAAFLGDGHVPDLARLPEWVEALGIDGDLKEYATWGQEIALDLAGLFALVAAAGRLENLPIAGGEAGRIAWLNDLFAFADQQQELGTLLKTYAVVPTQRGELRHLGTDQLQAERSDDYIPEQVLELLHQLGVDWQTRLLHRDVVLPGLDGEKLGLKEAATQLTALLNTTERRPGAAAPSTFLDRQGVDPLAVLTRLLGLTTIGAKETSIRRRLVPLAGELLGFAPAWEVVVEGSRLNEQLEYTFEAAESLLAQLLNRQLTAMGQLAAVQVQLGSDRAGALRWLDDYARLLQGSSRHRELLTVPGQRLLPDWLDELQPYEQLHNFGTEEQAGQAQAMRPLVGYLAELGGLPAEDDWRPRLLADGINLRLPRTLAFEQLGNKLIARTEAIRLADSTDEYRRYTRQLMALIEWCHQHKQLQDGLTDYLRVFADRAGLTFYMLNVELNGNSAVVMKLLKQPEQLARLAALGELGLSDAILDEVVEHARQLQKQAEARRSNFEVGHHIEQLFQTALAGTGLTGSLNLHYQGHGDCDYVVSNAQGTKFHLEVKSYLEGTEQHPLHIALSQAATAALTPDYFALCVVPRPADLYSLSVEDVIQRLLYVPVRQINFSSVVSRWDGVKQLLADDPAADVRLEVEITIARVRLAHRLVCQLAEGASGQGLAALVQEVKARLQPEEQVISEQSN